MDLLEKSIYSTKRVFTFQDACMYIGVSDSMLYKLTANKEIPHYKPRGKMIYFAKEELDEWLFTEPWTDCRRCHTHGDRNCNDTTILKTKTLWKTKEGLIITQVQDLRNISCWIFLPLPRSGATDTYETPPNSFWIDNSTIATLARISVLRPVRPSRKKTFNVSALVAASLAGRQVLNYRAHLPEETCQNLVRWYGTKAVSTVIRSWNASYDWQGLPTKTDNENLDFICLREYTPGVRIGKSLTMPYVRTKATVWSSSSTASATWCSTSIMPVNRWKSSTRWWSGLPVWSGISIVLHLNKGTTMYRGISARRWAIRRKTVLVISKSNDNPNISEVHALHIREKSSALCFYRWWQRIACHGWKPFVQRGNQT